jgi:hypothetical protein
MGTVIMMVATSTGGDQSALASIDVPKDGALIGVDWSGHSIYDTTLDFQLWQLSFGSTLSLINDSRQVISMASFGGMTVFTAVGAAIAMIDKYVHIPDIPVGSGERIFLHSTAAAGVAGIVRGLLHFDFDLDLPRARRR